MDERLRGAAQVLEPRPRRRRRRRRAGAYLGAAGRRGRVARALHVQVRGGVPALPRPVPRPRLVAADLNLPRAPPRPARHDERPLPHHRRLLRPPPPLREGGGAQRGLPQDHRAKHAAAAGGRGALRGPALRVRAQGHRGLRRRHPAEGRGGACARSLPQLRGAGDAALLGKHQHPPRAVQAEPGGQLEGKGRRHLPRHRPHHQGGHCGARRDADQCARRPA
mmetsp:Transcript_35195/g.113149  ORF Transcript_35195/g.113149 Transcript_35195/m.113149 type:complete len:222 (+) Transcript_35195:762-1427(+)